MNQPAKYLALTGGIALSFFAQQLPLAIPRFAPMHAQSASTVSLTGKVDERTVTINNVTYEVTGDVVSGRPRGERILLRKTTSSKQVLGDMGEDATTTLEAWPLGVDPKLKPIYALKVTGTGGQSVDDALFVADRGLQEVSWWSVYRLGTGQHLFDTYTPLLNFSISKDIVESRYVGLEVPPDETADARLKRPNVVAVITYASGDRVKREAMLSSDDPKQAIELRSYADTTRTVSVTDEIPPRALRIAFRPNEAPTPAPVSVTIPIAGDDLDLANAHLPPRLHLTAFKR